MTTTVNVIPDPAMIVLIGGAGAGKTTLAGTWPAGEVLELDRYCTLLGDDPVDRYRARGCDDQGEVDLRIAAGAVLETVLEARLARGLNSVVDAFNTQISARKVLVKLAKRHGMPSVAVVMSTPLPVCVDRTVWRTGHRGVHPDDVAFQHAMTAAATPEALRNEGFDHVMPSDTIGRLESVLYQERAVRPHAPFIHRQVLLRRRFGTKIASLATWQTTPTVAGWDSVADIRAGAEHLTLALRATTTGYHFEVLLPCPDHGCSGPAWLPVHTADDLLQAHRGDSDSERELTCAHNPARTPASGDTGR